MATPAQIRANRANARKSTGPRTPEGKARSSQNALQHGFRSQSSFPDPHQQAGFDRTFEECCRDLQPVGPAETACVFEFAAAHCRLRLLDRLEFDLCQQPLDLETTFRRLQTFTRYRAKPDRSFYRAIREWEALQAARQTKILHERTQFAPPAQHDLRPAAEGRLGPVDNGACAKTRFCTNEPNSSCQQRTAEPADNADSRR